MAQSANKAKGFGKNKDNLPIIINTHQYATLF